MQLSNATHRVLLGIKQGKTITQIANETKVGKGTISKKAKELIDAKWVEVEYRTSIKVMKITKAGELGFNELQQLLRVLTSETSNNYPIRFRLHNLLFRIPIIRNNPDINKQLEKTSFTYGRKRAFVRGWETTIDNEIVFYTPTSFQIFIKPIWAGSIDEAVRKAVWKVAGIYETLQEMFPYLAMSVRQELCRQHLAMIGGITIKVPEGFKYRSDTLVVDFSTGVAEIESENSVWAQEVMRRIVAFLDDVGREELITKP